MSSRVRNSDRIPNPWLRALGSDDPPFSIVVEGKSYQQARIFKHDFFAATGLYVSDSGKVVLKVGRRAAILFLPTRWIGEALAYHEARLYGLVAGLPGVPAFLGRLGPTAIVHDYIEGRPLARDDRVDDDFFPRLTSLLEAMHRRGVAYVDLEKRENILLGDDGRPYLIDFQISWHWPPRRLGDTWPARLLLRVLQDSDRYHLHKHWRRQRPDQHAKLFSQGAGRPPPWIRLHRLLFRPVTILRRQVLVWLGARDSVRGRSPG